MILEKYKSCVAVKANWGRPSIKEVWEDNLEAVFDEIQEAILKHPYIAVDTEYPGVVVRPILSYRDKNQYRYFTTKANVDMLRVIQVGLTLLNEEGMPRSGICTWNFNFRFDLNADMFAPDSIQLLEDAGLEFDNHKRKGIEMMHFGELLMTSGLVLSDKVQWICFHGAYDFAYLLRILIGLNALPEDEKAFFELLNIYFPNILDVKYLMTIHNDLKKGGGLEQLGEELHIRRVGKRHTAGSDSRLTGDIFFILKSTYFDGVMDKDYVNNIYGLGCLDRLKSIGSIVS